MGGVSLTVLWCNCRVRCAHAGGIKSGLQQTENLILTSIVLTVGLSGAIVEVGTPRSERDGISHIAGHRSEPAVWFV